MPFKSDDQRKYMWKNHPEIAAKWEDEGVDEEVKQGEYEDGGTVSKWKLIDALKKKSEGQLKEDPYEKINAQTKSKDKEKEEERYKRIREMLGK